MMSDDLMMPTTKALVVTFSSEKCGYCMERISNYKYLVSFNAMNILHTYVINYSIFFCFFFSPHLCTEAHPSPVLMASHASCQCQ